LSQHSYSSCLELIAASTPVMPVLYRLQRIFIGIDRGQL
jgi:hypothetical protein